MHPTLLEWLASFDKDCQRFSGATYIYNSLVMLGCERPVLSGEKRTMLSWGNGCDCLTTIAEDQKTVERCGIEMRCWHSGNLGDIPYQYVLDKKAHMAKCQENIALYTSMHVTHAAFNKAAWVSLAYYGWITKVRRVCLRDLRLATPRIVSNPNYGRELATLLVAGPKGWW